MTKLVLNTEYRLYERNSQAFCSSRQMAEEFKKEHKTVLRAITDKVEASKDDLVMAQFCAANLIETHFTDRGKRYPEYLLTRDGFSFIAMGFTGKKADAFKVAYIARFNQMETFIKSLQATKIEFPALTDAIMIAHEEPKHYHFSNEINMIYRIVLGMDAKKFRELRGLEKGAGIKPHLTTEQIKAIETLQRVDIGFIEAIPEYEQRKQALERYFEKINRKSIA